MRHRGFKTLALTVILSALCLTILSSPVFAQDIFGRISGTVTDSTGAVVAKAKVTVTNEGTNIARTVTTDESGFYVVPQLLVGTYSVTVEQTGFKKTVKTGNVLGAGGRVNVDIALQVGDAKGEILTVEAAGETINTVTGEVARTVDAQQVSSLALNTRNYMQLVSIVPGVVMTKDDQLDQSTSMAINNQTVNGNRADQNLVTVDGGYNMDSGSNGSQLNNVGLDFVQEVSVKTSNFSAEYGRNAGASINVVTKSGTNAFHGSAFEYFRNDALDALNSGTKLGAALAGTTPKKAPLRFNDFGWSLGGPIKKDKLFFFAGQEWKRIRQFAAPQNLRVPTLAELDGDFSDLLPNTILYYPGTTTPIPGNKLSNAGLAPTADGKAIANVYRLMATKVASTYASTATSGNNATFQPNNPSNWREEIVRIDYHPNASHSIYGRYLHDDLVLIDGFGTFHTNGALPTVPTERRRPGYNIQIGDVWMLRSNGTLVNEVKLSAGWNKQRIPPTGDTWKRSTYGFQFPIQGTGGRFPDSIPHVTFSGVAAPNQFDGTQFSLLAPTTDITPSDDLTWVKGKHTLKFGVMFARNRKDQNSRPDSPTGNIRFDLSNKATTTGIPFADALLGNFSTYAEQSTDPIGHFRFNDLEAYVNDSWRVSSRLSLELGLRMVRTTPTYVQGNNMSNFDPSLYDPSKVVSVDSKGVVTGGNPWNGIVRPGEVPADQLVRVPGGDSALVKSVPATAPRGFFNPETLFAPRVGFSFAPFSNQKTAIRGGFGIFYDKPEGNVVFGGPNSVPFVKLLTYTNGNLANPAGGTPSGSLTVFQPNAVDPNFVVARTMQFSLGVQQELPYGILADVSYVGMLGRHQVRQPSIDTPTIAMANANPGLAYNQIRPFLGYSDVRQFRSDGNSNYNGLQMYATKRKGDLVLTGSYTYSKALGTTNGINDNPEPEAPFAWDYLYGELNNSRRQVFALTYTYAFPFFKNSKGVLNAVAGGWELTGITRYQSGQYLTVNANTPIGINPNNTSGRTNVTRRASWTNGPVPVSYSNTPLMWFNTAAFAQPALSAMGNAPVANILGPAWQTWDWSLRKSFKLPREGMKLGFQADAFNLFNRSNWQNPNVTVNSGSFGKIGAANNPRNLQLALRLTF